MNISLQRNILLLGIFLLSFTIYGQQDPQYTQYMYNTMSVNPAYSGSRGH
ncbi:type IX secretion system membrane protein PorP/SprF, partial [Tenacibaculum maritimum]